MTAPAQNIQVNTTQPAADAKQNEKELNFRKQEMMFQRQLEQERLARLDAEKKLQELQASKQKNMSHEDEDDPDDPYVDKRRLEKKFSSFEQKIDEKINKKAEEKAYQLLEKRDHEQWLDAHRDFNEVMGYAEKFAEANPALANMLLRMPDSFDRQRLVYENIKTTGSHKQAAAQPSIQEKIDANKRSPYYQPSGVGSAPYNAGLGDFSPTGQKAAHAKMQELKAKLRL